MKLNSFTLSITNTEKTLAYYTKVLGFELKETFVKNNTTNYCLQLPKANFSLVLAHDTKLDDYQEKPIDNYWKYSLFVNNIEAQCTLLREQGYAVGEAFQFGDIGYLAHTADVENHKIEFIQKTFKDKPMLDKPNEMVLGLLTIRTKDPVKVIKFYEEVFDMKLFVRMYVDRANGFTLYFLGDKNLKAPTNDIDAVENREWMYQQNHLFIEIQHYWNSEYDKDFELVATENGLQTINFSADIVKVKKRLDSLGINYIEKGNELYFSNSDKHQFNVVPA